MQEIIGEILRKSNIEIYKSNPIGHHHLHRNLVFLLEGEKEYVLKVYGKEIKYQCEKRALEMFSHYNEMPSLIDTGIHKGIPWIIMDKIEGHLLEGMWETLTKDNKLKLMEGIGLILGRIHNEQTYDYFGIWKDLNPNEPICDYIVFRKLNDKRIMNRIVEQNLPHVKLFEKAFDELQRFYQILNPNIKSTICHRDFSYRNMIVEQKGNHMILKGVIDFEHCQIDDPSIDFNTLYQYDMINNSRMEEAFFKGYEQHMKKPQDFELRKKYYMLNLGLHTCSWSYQLAPDFYKKGIEMLESMI